ncbi:MAG: hypothetical protein AAF847_17100, partial [Bacteroidota bacterium]
NVSATKTAISIDQLIVELSIYLDGTCTIIERCCIQQSTDAAWEVPSLVTEVVAVNRLWKNMCFNFFVQFETKPAELVPFK